MSTDLAADDIVFVSDLHAGPGRTSRCGDHNHFFAGEVFEAFVADMLDQATSTERTLELVLLGDTFHIPAAISAAGAGAAITCLGDIEKAHHALFAALRSVLRAGHNVVMVTGNHDLDLQRSKVQAHLRQRLGDQLRFEPWIYHVPGLVYAEHGNQHHDINRSPTLLHPYRGDEDSPLRTFVSALVDHDDTTLPRRGLATLRAVPTVLKDRGGRKTSERYQRDALAAYATTIPAQTLARLDRLGASSLLDIARRVTTRAVRYSAGTLGLGEAPSRDRYLTRALPNIQGVLESCGLGVPHYVFGHTHQARDTSIGSARYLNCGTWSSNAPGGAAFPYVRLCGPDSGLRTWRGVRSRQVSFPR